MARCVVLRTPVIVTDVFDLTVEVLTVNVAVAEPAVTVTLAGTVATAVLLLDSVTLAPPAGAGPLRVTVPVEGLPPPTEIGFKVTELSVAVVTVKDAVRVVPP